MGVKPVLMRILVLTAALLASGCGGVPMQSQFIGDVAPQGANVVAYALPKGLVGLTIEKKSNALKAPTLEVLYVPDPGARYALHFPSSAFAYDKPDVAVSPEGLLQSFNADNEDKSPEIIKNVTAIFVEVAKGAQSEKAESQSASDYLGKLLFDPLDANSVGRARERLAMLDSAITLELDTLDGQSFRPLTSDELRDSGRCSASVCFRLLTPVIVRLNAGGVLTSESIVYVPDPRRVASFDVTRGACVHKVSKLEFTNGVLRHVNIDKPSEVLGCLTIPSEIVKSIVGLPTGILTQRKAVVDAQKGLIDSQTGLIKAQQALLQAQAVAAASAGGAGQ